MAFYAEGPQGRRFDDGIQKGVMAILASPKFLYRAHTAARRTRSPARPIRISDLELASRLSFFLWSGLPDEQLIDIAAAGKLQGSKRARGTGAPDARRSDAHDRWSRISPASG